MSDLPKNFCYIISASEKPFGNVSQNDTQPHHPTTQCQGFTSRTYWMWSLTTPVMTLSKAWGDRRWPSDLPKWTCPTFAEICFDTMPLCIIHIDVYIQLSPPFPFAQSPVHLSITRTRVEVHCGVVPALTKRKRYHHSSYQRKPVHWCIFICWNFETSSTSWMAYFEFFPLRTAICHGRGGWERLEKRDFTGNSHFCESYYPASSEHNCHLHFHLPSHQCTFRSLALALKCTVV